MPPQGAKTLPVSKQILHDIIDNGTLYVGQELAIDRPIYPSHQELTQAGLQVWP